MQLGRPTLHSRGRHPASQAPLLISLGISTCPEAFELNALPPKMKNLHPPEFVVLYRWKPKAGMEAQFVESWSQVTALFRERGSLGSRLHKGPEGFFYGYAQWPSAAARKNAFLEPLESPWFEKMSEAVAESLPEIVLEPISDYLVLPQQ